MYPKNKKQKPWLVNFNYARGFCDPIFVNGSPRKPTSVTCSTPVNAQHWLLLRKHLATSYRWVSDFNGSQWIVQYKIPWNTVSNGMSTARACFLVNIPFIFSIYFVFRSGYRNFRMALIITRTVPINWKLQNNPRTIEEINH